MLASVAGWSLHPWVSVPVIPPSPLQKRSPWAKMLWEVVSPGPASGDATFPFLSLLPGSRTSQKRQHPLFIQCAGSVPSPCPQSILTSPHIHCDFLFRRALPIEPRRRGGRLAKKHKFSGGFFYPTGANNARNQQFSAWRVTR
jgi:hypothetical protein